MAILLFVGMILILIIAPLGLFMVICYVVNKPEDTTVSKETVPNS